MMTLYWDHAPVLLAISQLDRFLKTIGDVPKGIAAKVESFYPDKLVVVHSVTLEDGRCIFQVKPSEEFAAFLKSIESLDSWRYRDGIQLGGPPC